MVGGAIHPMANRSSSPLRGLAPRISTSWTWLALTSNNLLRAATMMAVRYSRPEGRKLRFASTRDGNFEVYVMNVDGSGAQNVTKNAANDAGPAFVDDHLGGHLKTGQSGTPQNRPVERASGTICFTSPGTSLARCFDLTFLFLSRALTSPEQRMMRVVGNSFFRNQFVFSRASSFSSTVTNPFTFPAATIRPQRTEARPPRGCVIGRPHLILTGSYPPPLSPLWSASSADHTSAHARDAGCGRAWR